MNHLIINTLLLLAILSKSATPAAAKNIWQGCASVTEIPSVECESLVALYNSTNGEKWKKNSGWLQANTPCSWHGVSCRSGNVTRLDLSANNLDGLIPSALENLSELTWLSLGRNRLSGKIPPELGNLSMLTELNLGNNLLEGEIPSELGSLSSLQILHLSNNRLSGSIPATFGNLSSMKTIWMSGNRIDGSIPPELGKLAILWSLLLNDNRLSGSIPPELGNLSSLETIWLSKNQLSGAIPPELGNLSYAETVSLSNNQLSGEIPPSLGHLSNLKDLFLDNNRLTGTIPAALGNLSSLERLSLGNNKLTGEIPQEIGNLSSLKKISTYNNKLNDKVSWKLAVNSSGVEVSYAPTIGVPITAIPSKYSGNTSYSVSSIASGTLIHLKAPASTGIWPWKKKLVSWTGCDFMFGRTCSVKMLANKTLTANYDPEAEDLPESCDSMDIVLENPGRLNVFYTVTKYDPIRKSGEYVGDRDGVRIPESVTITTKAEELRAVEWRSKADAPLYTVITAEKCDGSIKRYAHEIGLGGMIQEDSTSFSDMKAKITVKFVSSLSNDEKNNLQ